MANEITTAVSLSASKGGASISRNLTVRSNLAGEDMVQTTQLIGTTSELVVFGEITGAPQFLMIQNLDATNYVEIGGDSGMTVFSLKIPAGKASLFAPISGTVYAKANTASVRIQIIAVEA